MAFCISLNQNSSSRDSLQHPMLSERLHPYFKDEAVGGEGSEGRGKKSEMGFEPRILVSEFIFLSLTLPFSLAPSPSPCFFLAGLPAFMSALVGSVNSVEHHLCARIKFNAARNHSSHLICLCDVHVTGTYLMDEIHGQAKPPYSCQGLCQLRQLQGPRSGPTLTPVCFVPAETGCTSELPRGFLVQ